MRKTSFRSGLASLIALQKACRLSGRSASVQMCHACRHTVTLPLSHFRSLIFPPCVLLFLHLCRVRSPKWIALCHSRLSFTSRIHIWRVSMLWQWGVSYPCFYSLSVYRTVSTLQHRQTWNCGSHVIFLIFFTSYFKHIWLVTFELKSIKKTTIPSYHSELMYLLKYSIFCTIEQTVNEWSIFKRLTYIRTI